MISIGGVVLNPLSDIIWTDRHASQSVEQTNLRTLGGRMVSYVGSLIGGLPITLVANENYGWQRKSVVDQLLALAAVPGGTYVFIFGGESYLVMFDNPGAVDMRPLVDRVAHAATDYFTGTIKLLTA